MKRIVVVVVAMLAIATSAHAQAQVKYVKYQAGSRVAWGILENETIREISAAPWDGGKANGPIFVVEGVPTKGWLDDIKVNSAGAWNVVGTTKYAGKTALVIRPVSESSLFHKAK